MPGVGARASGIGSPTKSNALVENWQRIVKETVIKRRVTESEFIASMYEEHQSRALEVLCRIKSNKKNKNARSPLKEEKWAKRQPSKVKPYAHRNLCDVASNYIKKSESESSEKSHGRKQAGLSKNCSSRKLSNCKKKNSKRSNEKRLQNCSSASE